MVTATRNAYVLVKCALVALWSEQDQPYAGHIRLGSTKLDSISTDSPALALRP